MGRSWESVIRNPKWNDLDEGGKEVVATRWFESDIRSDPKFEKLSVQGQQKLADRVLSRINPTLPRGFDYDSRSQNIFIGEKPKDPTFQDVAAPTGIAQIINKRKKVEDTIKQEKAKLTPGGIFNFELKKRIKFDDFLKTPEVAKLNPEQRAEQAKIFFKTQMFEDPRWAIMPAESFQRLGDDAAEKISKMTNRKHLFVPERATIEPEDTFTEGAIKAIKGFPVRLGKAGVGMLRFIEEFSITEQRKAFTKGLSTTGNLPAGDLSDIYNNIIPKFQPVSEPGSFKSHVFGASEAIADLVPFVSIAIATGQPWLAIAGLSAEVGGTKFDELTNAGISKDKAGSAALLYALAEGVGERFSLGVYMKPGRTLARKMVQGIFTEPTEEIFTEIMQAAVDEGILNQNISIDEFFTRTRDAGITGLLVAPGAAAIIHPLVKRAEKMSGEKRKQAVTRLVNILAESEATNIEGIGRERLPEEGAAPVPEAQPTVEEVLPPLVPPTIPTEGITPPVEAPPAPPVTEEAPPVTPVPEAPVVPEVAPPVEEAAPVTEAPPTPEQIRAEAPPPEIRPVQQKTRTPISEQPAPARPVERAPSTEPKGQPEATESAPEKRLSNIDNTRLNEAFTKFGPEAEKTEPVEPTSTSESGQISTDLLVKPLGFPKRAVDSVLYVGDRAVVTTTKGLAKVTRSLVKQAENFIPGIKSFNIRAADLMRSAIDSSKRLVEPIVGNREFIQNVAELRATKRVAQLEAKQSLKELSVDKQGKRLTDKQQEVLTGWFTGEMSDTDVIRDIGSKTLRSAKRYQELIDSNNKALLKRGIISDVTYQEYANKWLPRIYREKEFAAANQFLEISREVPGVKLKRIRFRRDKWVVLFRKKPGRNQIRKFNTEPQAREFENELKKDPKNVGIKVLAPITKAERKALGEVRDPALLVARALMVQEGLIANYDFLDKISKNPDFASDEQQKGFSSNPIPNTRAYGNLAGKFVRRSIRNEIVTVFNPESDNNIFNALAALHDVTLSQWKFGKTVLNPSTQMRNIYGNFMFMELDDFSALIPENLKYFGRAAKVLRADPGTPEWELKKFLIKERLINEDAISFELGALMSEVEKAPGTTFKEKLNNYITKRLDKLKKGRVLEALPLSEGAAAIYRMVDIAPKVASFMRNIEQGMTPEEAALKVRQNYPTYDTAITAKAVRSGARFFIPPFLTFTVEAARILARHAIKKPFTMAAFSLLMKTITDVSRESLGITKEQWERILKNTPEWRRTGFTTLLTPFRDENGDLTVFDLTYIIPLGVEISALENMFRTGKVVLGGADRVFNAPMNPFLGIGIQLISNRNLFTGQDIRKSTRSEAENKREQMRFIAGQVFPSIFPAGFSFRKIAQSIQRAPITREGEKRRSIPLTAADVLAGIKIIPFSPTQDQKNKLRRIERQIDDKLRGITGLARLPERFRGMSNKQRQQQVDELIADIVVLVKEFSLSSGLEPPEGFDELPLKLKSRVIRAERGFPTRPTRPGRRVGLPVREVEVPEP